MSTIISDVDVITEEPGQLQSPDPSWKEYNLLSLDGGGIRGYWSLLALDKLMEYVAEAELSYHEDAMPHSFAPQDYPENVSQVPLNENETKRLSEIIGADARCRALPRTQRYLPCHYFDYIGGSSTGALIAIMLGRFRMTVPDCLQEYRSLGGEIFGKPRFFTQLNFYVTNRTKYKGATLKRVFEDVTARRSEQVHATDQRITFPSRRGLCKTFATTLMMELPRQNSATPYLIRSYDHDEKTPSGSWGRPKRRSTRRTTVSTLGGPADDLPKRRELARRRRKINYGNAQKFQIWEVARAATAAPFFFEPLEIETPGTGTNLLFTDGGFSFINNPTQEGTREIEDLYGPNSIGVVVSVGTAREIMPTPRRGLRRKVKHIGSIATNPEVVHNEMEEKAEKGEFHYYRLNEPNGLKVELDEWEPREMPFKKGSGQRTLQTIQDAFANWAAKIETTQMLQHCAQELVRRRRARTRNRAKWERFAVGAQFKCRFTGCDREDFVYRSEFESHLTQDHNTPPRESNERAEHCKEHWRYQNAKGNTRDQ